MNECGVVNTNCYDTANRRMISRKSARKMALVLLLTLLIGALPANKRSGFTVGETGRVTCQIVELCKGRQGLTYARGLMSG